MVYSIAYLRDGFYVTGTDDGTNAFLARDNPGPLDLWHQRYGHVNKRCILEMIRNRAMRGMAQSSKTSKGSDWPNCVRGKMTRLSLKSRMHKATAPGEVIYADLCGPILVD